MNTIQMKQTSGADSQAICVLPLGDSVTDGFWLPGGYRNTLCRLIASHGLAPRVSFMGPNRSGTGYDTHHAGFSSFATVDIAESVSGGRKGITAMLDTVLSTGTPNLVFLQIGTNDILSLYDLPHFGERLEAIAERVLRALPQNGALYISELPPMDARDASFIDPRHFTAESLDAAIADVNAQIRSTAEKLSRAGLPVLHADGGGILTKADLHDGVHPSAEGYEKLGLYWFSVLAKELSRRRLCVPAGSRLDRKAE